MTHFLFTSESVSSGHPDKVADQIADALLDACLSTDPESKVAIEAIITRGLVFLAGEITSLHQLAPQKIIRDVIRDIGYVGNTFGFDYDTCGVLTSFNRQSPDIARSVTHEMGILKGQGAGDQGIMFGFACNETKELMPLPIMLAHALVLGLEQARINKTLPYLGPDAKTQVTVEYKEDHTPVRVHTVVISTQHKEEVDHDTIVKDARKLAEQVIPQKYLDEKTLFFINPTGRFVIGGPYADTGVTGRKTMVDSYGGMGRHGGGAFSGKDASKVDRSASYAARYVAKNLVGAGFAKRCEVQISYAIGVPFPISIKVDSFGTATVPEEVLARMIPLAFDLTPKGIIEMLHLKRPIYRQTASGGHFGRELAEFTWEKLDRVDLLQNALRSL